MSYERKTITEKGYGLVATASLSPGSVVLSDSAAVVCLSRDFRSQICNECFSGSARLRKCSGCKYVYYCSTECQRAAWKCHLTECSYLKRALPRTPPDFCMFTLRALLKYFTKNTHDSSMFASLMSHSSELKEDAIEKYETFAQVIASILGDDLGNIVDITLEDMIHLMAKLACNSFSITNETFVEIASGFFPIACSINHSCNPNMHPVFSGYRLTMRTLRKVEKGDELSINYTDTFIPAKERQKVLWEQYFFVCHCERCGNAEETKDMNSAQCKSTEGCQGVVEIRAGSSCSSCGKVSSYPDAVNPATLVSRLSSLLQSKDINHIALRSALLESETVLHPWNITFASACEKLFDLCIDQEDWETAIYWGDMAFKGLKRYLTKFYPVLGLHVCKLGKLHALLGNVSKAAQLLNTGKNILLIAYGASHHTVMEVTDYIFQLEMETNAS